ncbi:Triosephosphate isomerase [Pseudohaliea rubra DSM 19751]|uniref:Triosephosphate isomerase n=2 Tax=Pseudohaliea TaxID=1341120 RepID=A0A095XSQ1_9GAMM|nr:Triosephosphate isomerase [Pseudohaliea rubra DSM 19751]
MHGSLAANRSLLEGLVAAGLPDAVEALVCPPYAYLQQVAALCAGGALAVGAQDCSHMAEGAYTGEVSAPMLADLGCGWVILGHSERRQYHRETSPLIAAKLSAAARAGLAPIVCVGETLEQREGGEAEAVVAAQLEGALADEPRAPGLVIAYEPVWAIGTGLTASPGEAQGMHAFIRDCLADLVENAQAVRLLYGGSVKADNAAALFACPDIDGALVGGASLDAEAFTAIVCAAAED